eukprot:GHVS01028831.1.p1 GENE.GHVS01028831.1~~GHVS01028831.1.p1  ORF type:complete len:201 (+),score=8.12 GHVS01028831.1:318-920(+)
MAVVSDTLTEGVTSSLLLPPAIATFIMTVLELLRLKIVSIVLVEEERKLRLVRAVLFLCIGVSCLIPIFKSRHVELVQGCYYAGSGIVISLCMICFVAVKIRTTQKTFVNGTVRERLHQDFLLRMVECQNCVPGIPPISCNVHRQPLSEVSKNLRPNEGDTAPLMRDWPSRSRIVPVLQPHAGDVDAPGELPPAPRSKRS